MKEQKNIILHQEKTALRKSLFKKVGWIMEFTIENLEKLKGESQLQDDVIDSLLDQYEDAEDLKGYIRDVLMHGCISGCVPSLITYNQTSEFYKKHQTQINCLLGEALTERGFNKPEELLPHWEQEDPLCLELTNQNTLAWFAYEETVMQITYHFDELR